MATKTRKEITVGIIEGITNNHEQGEPIQPVLEIDLYHTKDGMNMLTGKRHAAGFAISFSYHGINAQGNRTFVIGLTIPRASLIDLAPRFSGKQMNQHIIALLNGEYDEVLHLLYERIREDRPFDNYPAHVNWREIIRA